MPMSFAVKHLAARFVLAALSNLAACAAIAQPAAAPSRTPPPVQLEQVVGHVYVLTGGGGANSGLVVGPEGALLVDSKSAAAAEQIVAIVKRLGSAPIKYLVNTHEHPDHTDGNASFGKSGVTIIAHEAVRDILAMGQRGGPPAPPEALPVVTFDDSSGIDLHIDGEHVRIFHAPPAHTANNSIVQYVDSNVLQIGDLYSPSRYMLIAGGTFQGFIDAADMVLALADDDTKIVPGVGAVSSRAQFTAYRQMLVTVRDRVRALIAQGKTLEEVVAAKPTAEFDATWGSPNSPLFLPVIYAELAKKQ